jgi:hypothetical protein
MTANISKSTRKAFENGDFHFAAANGAPEDWRTNASFALCGVVTRRLEDHSASADPEARFYQAVAHWINGDDFRAAQGLRTCSSEYAKNLLALIEKPQINILTQLPWSRRGIAPHSILEVGEKDPKFKISNISYQDGDLKNGPNASIHQFIETTPDFHLAEMVEWHLIPPDLQTLDCPLIGQTADYDLHLQTVYPWLRLFDELVVTDTTEYRDVAKLVDARVSTFPKPFALPLKLPGANESERDLDAVVTGTTLHTYFPDKEEMARQLLQARNFNPYLLNGFLPLFQYYDIQARCKLSIALPRHLGATPSRGYEALSMGSVLLAQPESAIRLYTDANEGVYTYNLENNGLTRAVEDVMANYPDYRKAAQRGMDVIRKEFNPWLAASQYLRFVTYLAARPRGARKIVEQPAQQRLVAFKGWLQADPIVTHKALFDSIVERWKQTASEQHDLASFCRPARESLLQHVHDTVMPNANQDGSLVRTALNIYRAALNTFPNSLAARFNFVRAACYFGEDQDVAEAMAVARNTITEDMENLHITPLDDVMTWDYCPTFFNYRDYLKVATEALAEDHNRSGDLKRFILAGLRLYIARMSGEADVLELAVELDPQFSIYKLEYAKALTASGNREDAQKAVTLLSAIIPEILYAAESWSLIVALKHRHDLTIPGEQDLQHLITQLENKTLLDEGYAGIRSGPYFHRQRLSLIQNDVGFEVRKRPAQKPGVPLSIILADSNGGRYPKLAASLKSQTLPRDQFELIYTDTFDCCAPNLVDDADTVIACGQNEFLYNRNVAFNLGVSESNGVFLALFAEDISLPVTALADLLERMRENVAGHFVLVNDGAMGTPIDTHFACTHRDILINAGGLDESAYSATVLGGPHEMVTRLKNGHRRIESTTAIPKSTRTDLRPADTHVSTLFKDLWAGKFSEFSLLPLRENPTIAALRAALP